MAAQKLFYEDSHMRRFEAQVLSCNAAKTGFEVVLDKTAFYPEGGGQPGDTGMLGGIEVTDTREKNGEIVHICTQALAVGMTVCGEIDWQRRFDFMQQHSGEHLVSGIIHRRFGYDNVGFHMGAAAVTIDFSGMLDEQQLREVEREANEMVWRNLPTQIEYPDAQRLHEMHYRSKKELSGEVRIVTFPGVDVCACCGTHVSSTGEIGLIKLLTCQKFHEGVRIEMLCGRKALDHVNTIVEQNHQTSVMLSAKVHETAASVKRMTQELAQLKYRAAGLEKRIVATQAESYCGAGDVLIFENGLSAEALRELALKTMQCCGGLCAVFSGSDEEGYKYCIGRQDADVRELVTELNAALCGRGGGKPFFAQGSVQADSAQIRAFFEKKEQA